MPHNASYSLEHHGNYVVRVVERHLGNVVQADMTLSSQLGDYWLNRERIASIESRLLTVPGLRRIPPKRVGEGERIWTSDPAKW